MSLAVTLSSMRTQVRQRANVENSTYVTDAEINALINEGLNRVYDLLVQARSQEYRRSSQIITTIAGTDTYALAADFYEVISVDIQYGNNLVVAAKPYAEFERNMFKFLPGWQLNAPVFYRLQGNNLKFIPMPSGQFTCTLNYYPVYVTLANDSDTFDGVSGWEAYAIWFATACCRAKRGPNEIEQAQFAMAQCAEMEKRIQELAALRDAGTAERVHDTTDVFDEYGRWW